MVKVRGPNPNPNPNPAANNYSEIQRVSNDELLETYRINKSKLHKIEHHLKFLKESLDRCKIPKGLQIVKEYRVIDETEDFKANIRTILMNAEIETTQAIIDHYEELYETINSKSEQLLNRIKELETVDLEEKVKAIDKPIEDMHQNLIQKREQKLKGLQTHIERTEKFVTKKKEPHRSNSRHTPNTNRRHPQQYQQRRPPYQQQFNSRARRPPPQQEFTPNPYVENNRHFSTDKNLIEMITTIVKNTIFQLLPPTELNRMQ